MGIISLMSSKLKMESRFPRESRLLYKGHSLHTAAMSNSPTAEMLFAPNGNMGSFFFVVVVVVLCAIHRDGSLQVESIVNTFHL